MKKLLYLTTFLLLNAVFHPVKADEIKVIDSLNKLVARQSGSQKIRTLELLIEQYRSLSPAKSIQTGEDALKSADLVREPGAQVRLLRQMASSAQFAGDLELAEQYFRRAVLLVRSAGEHTMLGHLLVELGNHFHRRGMYGEAATQLQEALGLAGKLNNDTIAMKAYLDLGNTAYDAGDIHLALNNYRQSLALAEKLGDNPIKARNLLNMGMAQWQFDNNEMAISLLREASGIFRKLGDLQTLGMALNNLGLIYFSDLKAYDSAAFYFNASLRIREQMGSPAPIAHVLVNQANLHTARQEFDQALSLYQRALGIFERADMSAQVARVHYHLGETYAQMGRTPEATAQLEATLALSNKNNLPAYEDLSRKKLLDLYAAAGNWPAFMNQFAYFRNRHARLEEEFNSLSIRESQLYDSLRQLRAELEQLKSGKAELAGKYKLLESIMLSLATLAAAMLILFIASRFVLRLTKKS